MYHGVNGSAEELHQRENRGPSYNPPLSRGMCHFSHRCRSMWRLRSRDTSRTPSRAEHASTGSFSRHSSSRSTTASPSARQRPRNGARPLQGKPLSVGSNNERRGEKSGGGGGVRLFYCRGNQRQAHNLWFVVGDAIVPTEAPGRGAVPLGSDSRTDVSPCPIPVDNRPHRTGEKKGG